MSKDYLVRLNETLSQIKEWKLELYPGRDTDDEKELVFNRIEYHFEDRYKELSDLFSLSGGMGIFQKEETTKVRHLKRLTLLYHRVMCYHRDSETLQLKSILNNLNRNDTLVFARRYTKLSNDYVMNQEKWAREVTARYGGKLVHYYRQSNDKRKKSFDVTANGWCLGMSVHWLGCKAIGSDMWAEHDNPERVNTYSFVMVAQKLRNLGVMGSSKADMASFRLKKFGLKYVRKLSAEQEEATAERLAQNIINSASPFIRIGQYYKKGGGHAMAAYIKNNKVYFFDPNLGEFCFESKDKFAEWFPNFTRFKNYRFKKHYIEEYQYEKPNQPVPDFLKSALEKRRLAMGYLD